MSLQQVSVKRAAELLDSSQNYVLDLCADGLLESTYIRRPGRTRGTRLISLASLHRLLGAENVRDDNVVQMRRQA